MSPTGTPARHTMLDRFFLLGVALVVIGLGTVAFLLADAYNISPAWVLVVWLSVGFFAAVGWDYRKEFKSGSFVLFFAAWLLLHSLIFAVVTTYWGWLFYLGAAFVELFSFYATAFWLFGLRPPPRRKLRFRPSLLEKGLNCRDKN